jgi:hypothetical protein
MNCKATRQHSPLSGALLGPKNLALDLNRKPANLIGNSFKIYLEYDTRTHWRTG